MKRFDHYRAILNEWLKLIIDRAILNKLLKLIINIFQDLLILVKVFGLYFVNLVVNSVFSIF